MAIEILQTISITEMSQHQVVILMERCNEFVEASNKAADRSLIGGVAVTGVNSDWFLSEWLKMVEQYPQVLDWSAGQVQQAIEGLWILDPEDLIGLV